MNMLNNNQPEHSISEIHRIVLDKVDELRNKISQYDHDVITIGEVRVDINGDMSVETCCQIVEEIQQKVVTCATCLPNEKNWQKASFVVCFNNKSFYDFRLVKYDGVLVAQSDMDKSIDTLPTFDMVLKKRFNDRERTTRRLKIEWELTRELDNAIVFDHQSEEIYFDKRKYDCVMIDTVLYNKIRPKGYKYEIHENDEYYIVRVQLTHNEVIKDENTGA